MSINIQNLSSKNMQADLAATEYSYEISAD
jgi:hypothetical protein